MGTGSLCCQDDDGPAGRGRALHAPQQRGLGISALCQTEPTTRIGLAGQQEMSEALRFAEGVHGLQNLEQGLGAQF